MSTTHLKFIEWRDNNGLHKDTLRSLSDLKFMKDELQFLENLVAAHALEVISEASSEKSKEIKQELESHKEILEKLLKELELHSNNLQILMDDEDVPGELEVYKNEHYRLLIEEMNFHSAVKKTKKNIFDMLSEIFKKNKQKKLT